MTIINKMSEKDLILKYNVPGPRYTSYPTVPFWKNEGMESKEWLSSLARNYHYFQSAEISIYIHLPYCESLCTFCGCHKRITKNHSVESPYIHALLKEWQLIRKGLTFEPIIKELHLGGGTPTFFNPDNLVYLLSEIFNSEAIDSNEIELGFEAHPANTSFKHLSKLYDFGFRRISIGVQDYNKKVQTAIHRIQSFEQVEKVHNSARSLGYHSISHDLVYGLPKQELTDIIYTIKKTLQLLPDRISLYSYAHVPWVKGTGQRGYDESDLPAPEDKRNMYNVAKNILESNGYLEIGMDHFALPTDSMYKAFRDKALHRNFMGYTTQKTNTLIGLGMSAISDSWFGFSQNEKSVEEYLKKINNAELAVFRGHLLRPEELEIRKNILELMCHFETSLSDKPFMVMINEKIKENLKEMVIDQLVTIDSNHVELTDRGLPFVRNCCMAFDLDLRATDKLQNMFSQTI